VTIDASTNSWRYTEATGAPYLERGILKALVTEGWYAYVALGTHLVLRAAYEACQVIQELSGGKGSVAEGRERTKGGEG